ncbi:MAG TPA: hypothetical protein VGH02_04910 [Rhizomicrobium sp.]|jgi:hypothetical protein
MQGIPVGDTILRAWGFAGRRALPLLGVSWLATVFYGLVIAYFLTRLSGAMLVWPRPDAGSFNNFALFYLFCLVLATAFANAALAVPMTREALEPGNEWKSAYFVIAGREWALFANLLLLYVIVIGVVSAIEFTGSVGIAVSLPMIGHDGVWQGIALAPLMTGVLVFVAVFIGLFLATRFGFFLAPIAVINSPARLLEAWRLSRGNFFRLLVIGLSLIVPVVVLALLAEWAALGLQFGDALGALFGTSHDKTPLFQMIQDHSGSIAAIWAAALLILNAIFAGASADAYAKVEHGLVPAVATREDVLIAEPAYAMAAVPTALHLRPEETRRFEPNFAEPEVREASEPASLEIAPVEPASVEAVAVEPVPVEHVSVASEPVTESVTETPALTAASALDKAVKAEATIASPDAETSTEAAEKEVSAMALPAEEPLAEHKDTLPEMDPMHHAAPAEPDPSGEPAAIPLPSFVKAQPSQEDAPSEAA